MKHIHLFQNVGGGCILTDTKNEHSRCCGAKFKTESDIKTHYTMPIYIAGKDESEVVTLEQHQKNNGNKMKEEQEKFCRYCGTELEEHESDRWNGFTGERVKSKHCTNLQCEEGCSYAGHQWGSILKLQNWEKCYRCGYVICDY